MSFLSTHAASASPRELPLVGKTLTEVFTTEQPERLIGGKAYDSDQLDTELREQDIGVDCIAQIEPEEGADARRTSDAPLRPAMGDRAVFAWLQNFRRIAMHFYFRDENYLGSVHLGCIKVFVPALSYETASSSLIGS